MQQARVHRVNGESSWQDDEDVSSTSSTRSPNSDPLEC